MKPRSKMESANETMAKDGGVDTTTQFNKYFAERQFDSWEEFETALKAFERETYSVFTRRNATTVETANKYRKEPIPERFRYASIRFICQHFGQPRKRGTGRRTVLRYLALDCPVFFVIGYTKGSLKVSKRVMCHQNHPLDEERNKYLACKRRLTAEEVNSIKDIVRQNPSNSNLKTLIRSKFNKSVVTSDIKNLKNKSKRNFFEAELGLGFTTKITKSTCQQALTESEKWRSAIETTHRLNLALSRSSTAKYEKRLAQLQHILRAWELDEEIDVSSAARSSHTLVESPATITDTKICS